MIYEPAVISKLTGKPMPKARDWLPTWEQMARFIDTIPVPVHEKDKRHSDNLFRFVVVALNTWSRPAALLELAVSQQVKGWYHRPQPTRAAADQEVSAEATPSLTILSPGCATGRRSTRSMKMASR